MNNYCTFGVLLPFLVVHRMRDAVEFQDSTLKLIMRALTANYIIPMENITTRPRLLFLSMTDIPVRGIGSGSADEVGVRNLKIEVEKVTSVGKILIVSSWHVTPAVLSWEQPSTSVVLHSSKESSLPEHRSGRMT